MLASRAIWRPRMQPSATAVGRALRRTQAAALSGPQGGDEAAQSLHRTFSFTRPRDGSEPPHRGVVYRAIQWHEIVQLVGDGSTEALAQLGRLPEDVLRYRAYRTKMLEEWESMTSCIRHTIWGWPAQTDDSGKRVCPEPADATSDPIWRANDFPYFTEECVEHNNVWCTRPLGTDEIWACIEANRPSAEHEHVMFINPPVLQSIPTVGSQRLVPSALLGLDG